MEQSSDSGGCMVFLLSLQRHETICKTFWSKKKEPWCFCHEFHFKLIALRKKTKKQKNRLESQGVPAVITFKIKIPRSRFHSSPDPRSLPCVSMSKHFPDMLWMKERVMGDEWKHLNIYGQHGRQTCSCCCRVTAAPLFPRTRRLLTAAASCFCGGTLGYIRSHPADPSALLHSSTGLRRTRPAELLLLLPEDPEDEDVPLGQPLDVSAHPDAGDAGDRRAR